MHELTTLERFTLFALSRSNRLMTSEALMSMMEEWGEPLEAALATLTKADRVTTQVLGSVTYYSAVQLTEEPILPGVSGWLHSFHEKVPQWVPGDHEANNYWSCATVMLAAVLTGSRDRHLLADLLSLPVHFVTAVLLSADNCRIWWSERVFDLEAAIRRNAEDFADIDVALHGVIEELAVEIGPIMWNFMQKARKGMLYGGLNECILADNAGNEPAL